MEMLTKESFKEKIFDYEKGKEWEFTGPHPTVIDFYADWCGPCKMVAPILETIAKEYEGMIDVYKINTDKEQSLSADFGISSIPTILFIPMEGKPQVVQGALSKSAFDKIIFDVLKVSKAA